MRKTTLALVPLALLLAAFVVTREKAPAPPHTYAFEGEAVKLDFRVSKLNAEGVELALRKQQGDKLFIQFEIGMEDALTPVVTMAGVSARSRMKGASSRRHVPDFPFFEGPNGERVFRFSFINRLARNEQTEQWALHMTYEGVPVKMVETLVVAEDFEMPPFLSRAFGVQGPLVFHAGRYEMDGETAGFFIPVSIGQRDEGSPVRLDFKVSGLNSEGVELGLQKQRGEKLFIQFGIGVEDALTPVVTMAGVSSKSRIKGKSDRRRAPDFPFLKGPDGEPVFKFAFINRLLRIDGGQPVLHMTYEGVPVKLVETLVVAEDFEMPPFLSRRFGVPGPLVFHAGKYEMDGETEGFFIPVSIGPVDDVPGDQ